MQMNITPSRRLILLMILFFSLNTFVTAQEKSIPGSIADTTFMGIKFRSIGPALMSGRIADIAIHPDNPNIWYVAVGSGGVWKTLNAGTTWTPVFDKQTSYSIGCITLDPKNPHTVWVGTGENVGGRHVGIGDGIYVSRDGGATWENMGLKDSQHISKILIHPENSDIIWVASQWPLWNKGGDRGLFKTIDGGKTWKKSLGDNEWTGVTDIVMDPRNPDQLYAATWQRGRTVASYMGGGPGTAIYSSANGGETWNKLSSGLPSGNLGKIGLAISPQQPDVIYAAIEIERRQGGVYRSANRGASWEKQSSAVAGATGPHYYQELYASPHQFDRIYLVDYVIQVSDDGGKNFRRLKEENKHPDNHAIVFRNNDPNYLLTGTDGGLYESFDLAENWRFVANLPVTQFYKIALDDASPFYNIYGGTQDNNTQGGPSRTDNVHGISNGDWFITLFGDGHQPATEPGNPDIVYSQWQEGGLTRIDRTSGEIIDIQPQPAKGENYERFNWDAPILVSPHSPTRLYFASQRLWKSENRGDSWTAISEDLTRNQDRMTLPVMDKTWSWDSPWDFLAMSNFNTITSLAESPLKEGVIYAGTDDGLIQVTEDGGKNWRKTEVTSLPGVPAGAFINDIKADLFDIQTVYIALDNHKQGDFNPYLFKSTDLGRTWVPIKGNLPVRSFVWRLVQDHVNRNLMFLGTESGIYFTIDGGKIWTQLNGGLPTISIRDLAIQKRENDLVAASFGRGFYILDDYSLLRQITPEQLKQEATLFPVRKSLWYIQRPVLDFGSKKGSQGAAYFMAPNPPFGAVFDYYLASGYESLKEKRQKQEKEQLKRKEKITFPGWEKVEAERHQVKPKIWLTIKDSEGNVVRRLKGPVEKGFHRVAWDLRFPSTQSVRLSDSPLKVDDEGVPPSGLLASPGFYSVSLSKEADGVVSALSGEIQFEVVRLREGALAGTEPAVSEAFGKEVSDFGREISTLTITLENTMKKLNTIQRTMVQVPGMPGELDSRLSQIRLEMLGINEKLNGKASKSEVGEKNNPTIQERYNQASYGIRYSTYGPTETHRLCLGIAKEEYAELMLKINQILNFRIPEFERDYLNAGGPWVEGMKAP
jgi:photosystem II stability/assembly factor-like uncharacterized protein